MRCLAAWLLGYSNASLLAFYRFALFSSQIFFGPTKSVHSFRKHSTDFLNTLWLHTHSTEKKLHRWKKGSRKFGQPFFATVRLEICSSLINTKNSICYGFFSFFLPQDKRHTSIFLAAQITLEYFMTLCAHKNVGKPARFQSLYIC